MELKKAILEWLLAHGNTPERIVACVDEFREHIWDENGEKIVGNEWVMRFIFDAEELLYGDKKL